MKKKIKIKKPIIFGISVAVVLVVVGVVGALNGWFGGGASIPPDTFTRGLVGYWAMDEGSGATAYDVSGNANNGSGVACASGHTDNGDGTCTGTFYPDAHPETTSVDGYVRHYQASGLAWADLKVSDGTEQAWDSETDMVGVTWGTNTPVYPNTWLFMYRAIILFDTSALPDSAVISAATFSVRGSPDKRDSAGNTPDINVYSSNPASNTALVAGDFLYSLFGTTAFSTTITYAGWSTTTYNDFALNSSGLAAISKTGVSKFGLRSPTYDVGATTPNWVGANPYADTILAGWASEKGDGYKPKLVVTYAKGPSWTTGKVGGALSFNGTDDYVDAGTNASYIAPAGTITLWLKLKTYGEGGDNVFHIMDSPDTTYGRITIYIATGQLMYRIVKAGTAYDVYTNASSISLNTWHHIVFVYGATQMTYVDGIQQTQTNSNVTGWTPSAPHFYFGWQYPEAGRFLDGSLDEVRIYNRALSAEEIRYHYNRGGPVAHWKFDEGSGSVAYDASGNENNGAVGCAIGHTDNGDGTCTGTFYPDAHPETTSVDGQVGQDYAFGSGVIWATIRVAAGIYFDDSSIVTRGSYTVSDYIAPATDEWVQLSRDIFLFDTSPLPDNAVISAATFSIYGKSKVNDIIGSTPALNVYSSNPASNIALVAADYTTLGTTAFSTAITYANWSTTGYNNYTLNASGIAAISKTSISKFGTREANYDASGTVPPWNGGAAWQFEGYASDKGPGYKPKLVVTYTKPGVPQWTSGKYGSALSFDGVDDYVDAGTGASLDLITDMTFSLWYKADLSVENRKLFCRGLWNVDGYYSVAYTNGETGIQFNDGATMSYMGAPVGTLVSGNWYHIVFTKQGANGKVFINGVEVTTSSSLTNPKSNSSRSFLIGKYESASGYIKGTIDDVRIYNYARSPDEIRLDYNAGFAAHFGPKTDCNSDPGACMTQGLVGYWAMDEGSGTMTYDASENSNNASLYCPAGHTDNGDGTCTATFYPDAHPESTSVDGWVSHRGVADTWANVRAGAGSAADDSGSVPYDVSCGSVGFGTHPIASYWNFMYRSIYLFDTSAIPDAATINVATLSIYGSDKSDTLNCSPDINIYSSTPTSNTALVEGDFALAKWGTTAFATAITYAGWSTTGYNNFTLNASGLAAISKTSVSKFGTRNANRDVANSEPTYVASTHGALGGYYSEKGAGYKPKLVVTYSSVTSNPAWTTGIIPNSGGKSGGGALQFDGVDDYVDLPTAPFTSITNATVEAWVYSPTGATGVRIWQFHEGTDAGEQIDIDGGGGTKVRLVIKSSVETAYTISSDSNLSYDTWYHIVVLFGSGGMKMFINGIQQADTNAFVYSFASLPAGTLYHTLGKLIYAGTNYWYKGLIDEVRIYNRALSAEEIRYHYNRGGPVAHWKFDEGSGSTAYDETNNNNDGTLYGGMATSTADGSGWKTGKYGSALSFDGVNDYVSVSGSSLNFDGSKSFTIEAWTKPNSMTSYHAILGRAGYHLIFGEDSTNKWSMNLYNSSSIFKNASGGSVPADAGSWIHIVGIYDSSSDSLYLYRNGVRIASTLSIGGVWGGYGNTWVIGDLTGSGAYAWNGLIDDVRIYNYVRTPDEIRLDYNAGFAAHIGPTSDCSKDPGACVTQGLVGYWNMDEGSGATAYDASGNANNGTLTAGPSWTKGKVGGGLQFDGTDDYINVNDANSLDLTTQGTVSAWIKMDVLKNINLIVGRAINGYFFGVYLTGKITWGKYNVDEVQSNTVLTTNTWYHVVGTRTGGTNYIYINGVLDNSGLGADFAVLTSLIGIGGEGTYYFDGLIDEVRIYNRALSVEEIRFHYNRGGPVGHWKFDEGGGGYAYDSTENNNDGKWVFTDTFYPDADPETTSVDGVVLRTSVAEAWTAIRTGAGNQAYDTDASGNTIVFGVHPSIDTWNYLYRSIFLFDTSSLPDDAVISATTLSVYGTDKADTLNCSPDINVYSSNPASNTGLVAADYQALGSTAFSTAITYTNFSITGYNDFALNSSGIATISKTGISKFGLRNANYDVSGTEPTRVLGAYMYMRTYYAEGGTGYKPKLVVKYTSSSKSASWTTGKYGSALSFDGTDDYVNAPTFTVGGNSTFEAWAKVASGYSPNDDGIITDGASLNNGLGMWSTTVCFRGNSSLGVNEVRVDLGSGFDFYQWHHYVGVSASSTGLYLYVDGVLKGSNTTNFVNTNITSGIEIGHAKGHASRYFDGLIDDVRIYNYARTPAQILQDYNAGFSTYFK